MKIKSMLLAVLLVAGLPQGIAHANQIPKVESFTFSPNDIDLVAPDTKVNFELVVSHPNGIENQSTLLTLTNKFGDTLTTYLTRTDSPISLTQNKVTFKGSLSVPRNIAGGVFNLKAAGIKNNSAAGYQYSTGDIEPTKIRELAGAENGLLVRNGGELNLVYDTFVGPTYQTFISSAFNDTATYNSSKIPIWKVGETFNPEKFYELRVKDLSLKVESKTPTTCAADGKELKLIKEGTCAFVVFTSKSKDYAEKLSNQTVNITAARSKPFLTMQPIPNQTVKNLPKKIEIFRVYTAVEGWVFPKSNSPSVCIANGFFVNLLTGGTCELIFQTSETSEYLASDVFKATFQVEKDPQTIIFSPELNVKISSKSIALTATASGGGIVSFTTTSTGICSITGSTLNLLKSGNCTVTATQAGTSTLAPVSATSTVMITGSLAPANKTITCVMGKKSKKVSGTNPKCPTGYKLKK